MFREVFQGPYSKFGVNNSRMSAHRAVSAGTILNGGNYNAIVVDER